MKTYAVQWYYKSGLGGPWGQGLLVDLTEAQAEAVNHDSPGVLIPADSPRNALEAGEGEPDPDDLTPAEGDDPPAGEALEAGEGERQVTAARDRAMHKPPRTRAAK